METYKRWVRRNRDSVQYLGSLTNGLTWIMPEQFVGSEIGPEAVTSILGIITSINEHILETPPKQVGMVHVESSSCPLPLCITLFKNVETLIEVAAQEFYGEEKKWNFMAVTEAVKVLIRLSILQKSGYKMLLNGGETSNDQSESDDSENSRNEHGPQVVSGILKNHNGRITGTLEGRALSAFENFGENAWTVSKPSWLQRVQHMPEIVKPPTSLAETPSLSTFLSEKGIPGGLLLTAEMMSILRPLIYVLLIRKYGVRSWFPWLTSLAVDLIGNGIISFAMIVWHTSKDSRLSSSEKSELKTRRLLWALYLMRDPFFAKYTRQRLDGTQKLLEPVPIAGFLSEKLVELVVGAQTRYTYMSGS